ncbi:MAG: NHLP bacteriocin export ABC transporter permease/ATPase subunit [Tatlockia sp.]|nr:NHLP bacteriocin export ABC transporter permease/ATPase subunit [Tatlockia sp.]
MKEEPKLPTNFFGKVTSLFTKKPQLPLTGAQPEHALIVACQLVAEASNIPFSISLEKKHLKLQDITNEGEFRIRKVTLTGKWWRYDNGPLLAFYRKNKMPCVLLPTSRGKYCLIDPQNPTPMRISADNAETLLEKAYYFYRPFPDDELNCRSIFKFTMPYLRKDFRRIFFLQSWIGVLMFLIPIATSQIFSTVIPNADKSQLVQWIFPLLVTACAVMLFNLNQLYVQTHLRFRIVSVLQSALWDRILRLPIYFFRQFTSGDLSTRCTAVDTIQQTINNDIVISFINGIFAVFPLILMFYFNAILAITATFLIFIFLLIYLYAMVLQLHYQRKLLFIRGSLASWVLELFNSISKLRTANAEQRVFTIWSEKFAESVKLFFKFNLISAQLNVFTSAFAVLVTLIIYILVERLGTKISFGDFMGFTAAYGIFSAALFTLVTALCHILQVIPTYERAQPILQMQPEQTNKGIDPGHLKGQIEVQHLSFHYQKDIPVLYDLNFIIKPGEFAAIVGPSGAGKSSLIRLFLGFDELSTGKILYDNHNLSTLNKLALRCQLGVVLQNDVLMPGTIFENIAAAKAVTLEEAWEALRLVGFQDEVKCMPMGMHTLIMEGGKNLSFGQRQRLMIARALVRNPRILFLDEATSALDNMTQDLVHRNLEQQKITRIVIAQRLNTIRDANCIYLLNRGKLAQQGTYEHLLVHSPLFADLVKSQEG